MSTKPTPARKAATRAGPASRAGRVALVGIWLSCLAGTASVTPASLEAQTGTRALIVVGLGGTDEYRQRFHEQATTLRSALLERYGLAESNVVYLGERVELDPEVIDDRSVRENVLGTLDRFAEEAAADNRILVVLIGHGTSGPSGTNFNLPGPDLGPDDFAAAFSAFDAHPIAFVHTGSGSGAFLEPVAGPNRVVITATRTGRELNATRFGEHFVAALAGDGADIDRDGRVSLREAYTYARAEVSRYYESENQIQTEHATLVDEGVTAAPEDEGPGRPAEGLADAYAFGSSASAGVPDTDDPELQRLYDERAQIQSRIDELRAREGSMDEEAYLDRMEELLVELGLKNREIRAAGGGTR